MLHQLHIEESEVPRMCLELYREHGTTMAGLKVKLYPRLFNSRVLPLLLNPLSWGTDKSEHNENQVLGYEFDDDEFHAFVHGRLPYETLEPDPVLRNILLSLPQRKIVSQI